MTLVPAAMRAVVPGEGSLGTPQAPPSLATGYQYVDKDGFTVSAFTNIPVAAPAIDYAAGGYPMPEAERTMDHTAVCKAERRLNSSPHNPHTVKVELQEVGAWPLASEVVVQKARQYGVSEWMRQRMLLEAPSVDEISWANLHPHQRAVFCQLNECPGCEHCNPIKRPVLAVDPDALGDVSFYAASMNREAPNYHIQNENAGKTWIGMDFADLETRVVAYMADADMLGESQDVYGQMQATFPMPKGSDLFGGGSPTGRVSPSKGEITIHCHAAEAVQALDKLGPDGQRIVEIKPKDPEF
jgi:hypothetical protein